MVLPSPEESNADITSVGTTSLSCLSSQTLAAGVTGVALLPDYECLWRGGWKGMEISTSCCRCKELNTRHQQDGCHGTGKDRSSRLQSVA